MKERLNSIEFEDWRENISEKKLDFLEELQKFVGVNQALAKETDFGVSLPSLEDLKNMGFTIIKPEPPPDIKELADTDNPITSSEIKSESHNCESCYEDFGISHEAVRKVSLNGRDHWLCSSCLESLGYES